MFKDLSSIYAEPNNSIYAAPEKSANEYAAPEKSTNCIVTLEKSVNDYAAPEKSANNYEDPEKSANGYAAPEKSVNHYATPANDYATPMLQTAAILNGSCQTKMAGKSEGKETEKWNRYEIVILILFEILCLVAFCF